MTGTSVHRDERTLAIENQSYRWAFYVFSYGLLAIVAYRSYVRGEAAWDLMALVLVGGGVASLYQFSQRVLTGRSAAGIAIGMIAAALVAAAVTWLR